MNNVWVKIKEINELCGVVNFSSHNQMREAIEGTMEITETLLSEQPSQSNVSEDVPFNHNFSYCQREIEGNSLCSVQCEHCAEYYKPLGKQNTIPVSEDVEKAAEKYAGSNYVKNHIPGTWIERHHAFKAGAEWQKQQDGSAIQKAIEWCDEIVNFHDSFPVTTVDIGRVEMAKEFKQFLQPINTK